MTYACAPSAAKTPALGLQANLQFRVKAAAWTTLLQWKVIRRLTSCLSTPVASILGMKWSLPQKKWVALVLLTPSLSIVLRRIQRWRWVHWRSTWPTLTVPHTLRPPTGLLKPTWRWFTKEPTCRLVARQMWPLTCSPRLTIQAKTWHWWFPRVQVQLWPLLHSIRIQLALVPLCTAQVPVRHTATIPPTPPLVLCSPVRWVWCFLTSPSPALSAKTLPLVPTSPTSMWIASPLPRLWWPGQKAAKIRTISSCNTKPPMPLNGLTCKCKTQFIRSPVWITAPNMWCAWKPSAERTTKATTLMRWPSKHRIRVLWWLILPFRKCPPPPPFHGPLAVLRLHGRCASVLPRRKVKIM